MKLTLSSFPQLVRKHFFAIMGVFVALIVVCGISVFTLWGFWFKQWDGPFATRVAGILHLPAGRIDGTFVAYTEYLTHLKAERTFLAGDVAKAQNLKPTDAQVKALALDRAIRTVAVDLAGKNVGITVTALDAERVFQDLVSKSASTTSPGELAQFLKSNFGWDEDAFKQHVLRPAMTEDAINKKYEMNGKAPNSFTMELNAKIETGNVKKYLRW